MKERNLCLPWILEIARESPPFLPVYDETVAEALSSKEFHEY